MLENTRRVFQKIERVTSILLRKKLRSIIFEWQPLFSASGRVSSTSKDQTHHYSQSLQKHSNEIRIPNHWFEFATIPSIQHKANGL